MVEVISNQRRLERVGPRKSGYGLVGGISNRETFQRGWPRNRLQGNLPNPSKSNCLSRRGHTTDSKLATDAAPRTPNHSDHAHSSIVALCTRVSKGSPHDKRRARTTGTRLEVRPVFELRVWSVGGDHKLLGALSLTPTLNVGAPLHAPQNSSEASCSSNVDTYQRFLPPSHAWFKVTMKASRQRAVPPTDGRGAEIETH